MKHIDKFLIIAALCGSACGGEGDKGGGNSDSPAQASIPIEFPESTEVGDRFILSPFVLGDVARIDGKTTAPAGELSISADRTALSFSQPIRPKLALRSTEDQNYRLALRTFLNRARPSQYQSEGEFVSAAARFFTETPLRLTASDDHSQFIKEFYQAAKVSRRPSVRLTQADSCPTSFKLPGREAPIELSPNADSSVKGKEDTANYCLIYLGDTGISEPDKAKTQASIEQSLTTIKKIIGDDLATPVNGYAFKPLIIVLPMDDQTLVPESFQGISGAFLPDLSIPDQNGQPTLVIASDQTLANAQATDQQANDFFHSTLGHELFHAAFNFHRIYVKNGGTGEDETVAIDEGLAHLVEDILGYGPINFPHFAGAFLLEYPGFSPSQGFAVLDTSVEKASATLRGAAHSFLYYLTSQSGGLSFDANGKLSGGGGLDFLNGFFASDGGAEGLASAFKGKDYADAFRGFVGALAVNNSDRGSAVHDVQDPTPVTNLVGATSHYGMKFNDFSGIPSLSDKVSGDDTVYTAYSEKDLTDIPFHYYQVNPVIVTVTADVQGFLLVLNGDTANVGVSFIKVQ